jgi:hypothetical protein
LGHSIGAVIESEGIFYMRAADGFGGSQTFDLRSGQLATISQTAANVSYDRWEVGQIVDDAFVTIFAHPHTV